MAGPILYGMKGEQKPDPRLWAVVHHGGSGKLPGCGCEDWLDHWRRGAKSARAICVYLGCTKPAKDGAHVKRAKADGTGIGASYIVPLCDTHNRSRFTNPFYVRGNCVWIVQDKQPFCKKGEEVNRNKFFHVQVTGTSNKTICSCADALAHVATVTKRSSCCAVGCSRKAALGALVKSLDGRRDKDNWFAPLCADHGKKNKEIWLDSRTYLVSPRPSAACPKP